MIRAIVSDFGGVLTSPLMDSFSAFQKSSAIPLEALYGSMVAVAQRTGKHPLHELETGRLTEHDFLEALGSELAVLLGRPVDMHGFGAAYLTHLQRNEPMIELMRELRREGHRMAICTNNVREWEPIWRAMLPVDEIFELVVDSAFVGFRKPEPEIYALTLERIGVPAGETLFIDDIDVNCEAARASGMHAIQFISNEQTIPEIRALLGR